MDAVVKYTRAGSNEIGQTACAALTTSGIQLFGNEVFVVFSLRGRRQWRIKGKEHFNAFYQRASLPEIFAAAVARIESEFDSPSTVILMTTYNRPHRLAASLRTIAMLGAPVLVVDDGSYPQHDSAYAEIYKTFDVRVLRLPDNRGLSCALNAGLSYWLADPRVESIFVPPGRRRRQARSPRHPGQGSGCRTLSVAYRAL